jgi:hypothetical protein
MKLKTDLFEWMLNRTNNGEKTTRRDIDITFHEVLSNELSSILADLMEDGLIDLKNYEYRAVVRG